MIGGLWYGLGAGTYIGSCLVGAWYCCLGGARCGVGRGLGRGR